MARKDWTQSLSRKQIFPLDLRPEQVSLLDIGVSLSRKHRFSGQTRQDRLGYSVAQHCVEGSKLIAPPYALAFLLHEVSEVYLPDIPQPVKPNLYVKVQRPLGCFAAKGDEREDLLSWEELEREHAQAVFSALGLSSILPLIYSPEVKQMDLAMLAAEKRDLMGQEPAPWGLTVPPVEQIIEPWEEHTSRLRWFERYAELRGMKFSELSNTAAEELKLTLRPTPGPGYDAT